MSTTIHEPGEATPETPVVHNTPVETVDEIAPATEKFDVVAAEVEQAEYDGIFSQVPDDQLFDPKPFTAKPPIFDNLAADKLTIGLAGSVELDAALQDDLDLFDALRLGKPLRLTVHGYVSGKNATYKENADGEVSVSGKAVLKVHTIEVPQ